VQYKDNYCRYCYFGREVRIFGRDLAITEIICRAPITKYLSEFGEIKQAPTGRIVNNNVLLGCPAYRPRKP